MFNKKFIALFVVVTILIVGSLGVVFWFVSKDNLFESKSLETFFQSVDLQGSGGNPVPSVDLQGSGGNPVPSVDLQGSGGRTCVPEGQELVFDGLGCCAGLVVDKLKCVVPAKGMACQLGVELPPLAMCKEITATKNGASGSFSEVKLSDELEFSCVKDSSLTQNSLSANYRLCDMSGGTCNILHSAIGGNVNMNLPIHSYRISLGTLANEVSGISSGKNYAVECQICIAKDEAKTLPEVCSEWGKTKQLMSSNPTAVPTQVMPNSTATPTQVVSTVAPTATAVVDPGTPDASLPACGQLCTNDTEACSSGLVCVKDGNYRGFCVLESNKDKCSGSWENADVNYECCTLPTGLITPTPTVKAVAAPVINLVDGKSSPTPVSTSNF